MDIWEPKPPRTLWATLGLLQGSCTFLLYMFRTDLLTIIRSLNTVNTTIGICHTSYVDRLLARSGTSSILTSLADG